MTKLGPPSFSKEEGAAEKYKEIVEAKLVPFIATVAAALPADKKYICGDDITIYDFVVAGMFTNFICSPTAKYAELFAEKYAAAPDRVKKYVDDFTAEMKEYLDARPTGFSV